MHIFIYENKQVEEVLWQSCDDFLFTLALLSDAKCDKLCFEIGTFASQREDKAFGILIEKIYFPHFSITSSLTQKPISHTLCQSKDGERQGMHHKDTK